MALRAKQVAQGVSVALMATLLGLLVGRIVTAEDAGAAAALDARGVADAPPTILPRLNRPGTLSLGSLRGKVVVVNFWASWCRPCRDESPLLQQAWTRDRTHGLVVLGVDVNDGTSDALRFVRRYGLTYPLVHDARGSTLGHWGVFGLPFTFVVDRRGRIVGRIAGGLAVGDKMPQLRRWIARELAR